MGRNFWTDCETSGPDNETELPQLHNDPRERIERDGVQTAHKIYTVLQQSTSPGQDVKMVEFMEVILRLYLKETDTN